ncbi:hypothetical protein RR46_04205 [Papilio xuthus]|uniref:Uncharacterized protein n=1 Tax=Papilio xuthus TaxID=66420 RepID=A0A194QI67_PAPXU|nr:hypothetical protein RR46_04205 [Papilio xuthus]
MSAVFGIASVPRGTHQMFKLSPASHKATNQFTTVPVVCNSSFDLQTAKFRRDGNGGAAVLGAAERSRTGSSPPLSDEYRCPLPAPLVPPTFLLSLRS